MTAPGVGLAAPQIGVHQRVMVIDVSAKDEPPNLLVAINPVIVYAEGESYEEEGCLSVPKYAANVRRHARVVVKAISLDGEEVTYRAEDSLAIAFQHEIDHLDGILFIDHLSPLKREMFRKQYRRMPWKNGRSESDGRTSPGYSWGPRNSHSPHCKNSSTVVKVLWRWLPSRTGQKGGVSNLRRHR